MKPLLMSRRSSIIILLGILLINFNNGVTIAQDCQKYKDTFGLELINLRSGNLSAFIINATRIKQSAVTISQSCWDQILAHYDREIKEGLQLANENLQREYVQTQNRDTLITKVQQIEEITRILSPQASPKACNE